jgi:hypothetical protein
MASRPRFRLLKECFHIHFFSVSSLSSVRVLYVQLAVVKPCCGAANKKYGPKMDTIEKLGEHANVHGIKDNPEHCAALIVAGIAALRVQF